jgi:hypothetical protein
MIGIRLGLVVATLAAFAVLIAGSADARHRHRGAAAHTTATGLAVDSSGTPIIMRGYEGSRGGNKGRVIPQVSGPITVPPPHTGLPNLPARELLQASPPPILAAPTPSRPSFSDRVTNCIHSYPLNAGVGNNPTNQTAYMGQCANQ